MNPNLIPQIQSQFDMLAQQHPGLLFQDPVADILGVSASPREPLSLQCLEALHNRIQATDLSKKLQAIPEKSPDLLGVILKEGKI